MMDPFSYYSLAFFMCFMNMLGCGQRLLDRRSTFPKKLLSLLLYMLMTEILFFWPILREPGPIQLVLCVVLGYLHYFHDRKVLS